MIFDSHAHYDSEQFDIDRDELLGSVLPQKGVVAVINMAADYESLKKTVALCEKYDFHLGTAQPEKNTHQEQPAAEMVWETVGTAANDTVCLWKTQTGTSCKMEKSIPVLRLYRQFCGVKNEKICA